MAQNIFKINRLFQFILRQGSLNIQPMLVAIGGVFGLLTVISFLTAYFNPEDLGNMIPLFLVVFFISGFIFTSKVFSELNSQHRSYSFLTLPVSTLEKIVGSWLLTSPIYAAMFLFTSSIIYLLSTMIAGRAVAFMDFFHQETFITAATYMVIQTIFFLGACTFKSNNFLKTLLSLFILSVSLGIFALIVVVIMFDGHFDSNFNEETMDTNFQERVAWIFTTVIPFVFWYILGPFLLTVSYFKLKERQA